MLKSRQTRRDEPSLIGAGSEVGSEVLVELLLESDVDVVAGFPKTPPLTADGVGAALAVDAADLKASSVSEEPDLRRINEMSGNRQGASSRWINDSNHAGLTVSDLSTVEPDWVGIIDSHGKYVLL
jgi:hypothetical protein